MAVYALMVGIYISITVKINEKTLPLMMRQSQQTKPQKETLLPTMTKQRQKQDANDADFNDKALKPRQQQSQRDANNDNNNDNEDDNKTPNFWQLLIKYCHKLSVLSFF